MGKKIISKENTGKDNKKNSKSTADERSKSLRELAEKRLFEVNGKQKEVNFDEAIQIMHELQVLQIELELQNEELRQAHLELDESREKYFDLYNFAPVGYITLNEKGTITESNLTASNLLGVVKTKLTNSPFTDFIFKEDQDIFYLRKKHLAETEVKQQFELRLIKKDNTNFWAHIDVVISEKENGEINNLITIVDISKLKIEEEKLLESERFLNETQIIAHLGTYTMDITTDKWRSSQVFDDIFGIDSDFDKSAKGWVSIIHPEWQKIMYDYFTQEVIRMGIKFDKEYKIIRQNDKAERWVHGIGKLKFNEKNQPIMMLGTIRDITEQKQAEESINKSQLLLLSSIECQKDMILFSIDRNYRYLYFNKTHSNVMKYAYNTDVKIGMNILEYITSDEDRKTAKDNYDRALKGESHSNVRIYGDVNLAYYESFFNPIVNDKNEIIGATGLARNITERKKAEEHLLFINKAIESISDAIGISDANGHHIYQNKALTDLFEYTTAKELEAAGGGTKVVKDANIAKEMFGNIMSGKSWSGELEMVTKSGRVFPAFERADAIKDSKGNLIGLIGIITDITKRKKVEERLIASETRYRRLFETAKDGILILDAETGMIVDVNPFLIELLGYSHDMFLGKSIWDIGFFKDIFSNEENFLELKQKEYIRYEDLPLETADGKKINVEFVSNVYLVNQQKVIQCNIRDITERKQVEEEIKLKNEELGKTNAEKDKFFSIIAHDLRSPFTGFLGFTDLLKKDLHNMSISELQKIADRLNNSANKLFGLLTNLLEWSIAKRGLTAFNPVRLSLKNILEENIKIFNETVSKKGIEIEESIPEDLFVMADKSMLETIIRNVVSNALKFTKKGGRLAISAIKSEDKVVISVKDTGIGMSNELMNDLFKIDKRTNRIGTDNEPSSGLGLLLCKEFIEMHKGKIWIVSEEEKGSEIVFSLPLV